MSTKLRRTDTAAAIFDPVPPRAASLVESLRAFGYDLPTAIADLIDNSIAASARNIHVEFKWTGMDSVIAVTDDGRGMSTDELVAAMRVGSRSPLEVREPHDLGRFGLGLKTASFSQCRRITVHTSTGKGSASTRCWDLDHIAATDDWQLLRAADAQGEAYFRGLPHQPRGTTVLWQKLDQITKDATIDDDRDHQAFLDHAKEVRMHIAMVYHRIMTDKPAIRIWLNGHLVVPWDPFLEHEQATQILTETRLPFRGSIVEVRPYILPHQSKVSSDTFEQAAGPRGWNAHQGFYVYRNRRLLVPGDWLGLGWSKEEHYKLARILVEVPNALDQDWKISVTKSRAIPPALLRDDLRRIGSRARTEAKRIYSHRGAKLIASDDSERIFTWIPTVRHGKTSYTLNRSHPLLKRVIESAVDRTALNAFLRLVEETVPHPHITMENSERPGSLAGPFDHGKENEIRQIMEEAYDSLIGTGYGPEEAINRLQTIWPFELFPSVLQSIREARSRG